MTIHSPIHSHAARIRFFPTTGVLRRLQSGAIALGILLLPAFSGSAHAETSIDDAWVRATIGTQRTTGAFMTITSDSPARLVAVSSPVAGTTEIHEMTLVDNIMRMRPLESLALPAGEAVALRPGGYHLMLFDLKSALNEGGTIPLTLTIESDGGSRSDITVQASVRSPMGRRGEAADESMHGHGHHMR